MYNLVLYIYEWEPPLVFASVEISSTAKSYIDDNTCRLHEEPGSARQYYSALHYDQTEQWTKGKPYLSIGSTVYRRSIFPFSPYEIPTTTLRTRLSPRNARATVTLNNVTGVNEFKTYYAVDDRL